MGFPTLKLKTMKSLAFLAVLLICADASAKPPCDPITGDATTARGKALNRLKNRSQAPTSSNIDSNITIARLLAPGGDRERFPATKAATITGYVALVKNGQPETCNCHKPGVLDTHIEIVADPKYAAQKFINVTITSKNGKKRTIKKDSNEKYHVIVEVTPRVRNQMKAKGVDWSTQALIPKLTHHWVQFTGWILFDSEHASSAKNTNPGNKLNWRATCTELHPVFAIKAVN
ncbi:MAG TPA: hypothetical protein DCO65_10145 [Spartobacteria bacterium]|jgi:hypothetical protein|nr:hypothetical protein [Spartobacteria bacterium]